MTGDGLPTQADFDPWNGNPDAGWAHGVFGGLSIAEATLKYQERPDIYWEAFMGMGGKAFAYYFPIVEHYVYSVAHRDNDPEDREENDTAILAHSIKCQFKDPDNLDVLHLAGRVIELAKFVHDNISRFEPANFVASEYQESTADAWAALVDTVQSCQNPPVSPTNV